MKYTIKIIIFMLALLVYVSILACGGGGSDGGSGGGDGGSGITFSTSDLGGTWQHVKKGSTIFGNLDLTAGGIVAGGGYTEIGGDNAEYIIDDVVSINSSGAVSGSLTTNIPTTSPPRAAGPTHSFILAGSQMSRDKGLIITAGSTPNEMGLFLKQGASYSTSDLEGEWSFGSQNEYGTFTLDTSGNITDGTYSQIGGGSGLTVTGGPLTITVLDNITGTINNLTVVSGWMSPDKNIIFLVFAEDHAYVAVRMNAKFGAEALGTDTYKFVSFSDTPPKVAYGTITMTTDINGDTTVDGGTWIQIGGTSGTYDRETTVEIDTYGVVSGGTLIARDSSNSTTTTFEILSGQVSSNRNFSINISQEVGGVAASQITLLVRTP